MCFYIDFVVPYTNHKKVKGSIVFNLTYKTYVYVWRLPMHKYVVYQINNTDRQKRALCKYFKTSF